MNDINKKYGVKKALPTLMPDVNEDPNSKLGKIKLYDSDDENFSSDNEAAPQGLIFALDKIQEEEYIMCCCHKNEEHDETMKFQLIYDEEAVKQQGDNHPLKQPLFDDRPQCKHSVFEEDGDHMSTRARVDSYSKERKYLYGLKKYVNEVVEFITSNDSRQRVCCLVGNASQETLAPNTVAQAGIDYAMTRHHVMHGAYHVSAQNVKDEYTLFRKLFEPFGVFMGRGFESLSENEQELKIGQQLKGLKEKQMLFFVSDARDLQNNNGQTD